MRTYYWISLFMSYKVSKLAYRILVILTANERVKKNCRFKNVFPAYFGTEISPTFNTNNHPIEAVGRGGLQGCEMLRIPHCLDSRLTGGGKVVSLTRRPRCTPQKHFYSGRLCTLEVRVPGYRSSRPWFHSRRHQIF
jgi:hypothetical protein